MKIFLAIADNGSLHEAAKVLRISHATVFRKLNAYEEKSSVRLFDRSSGAYELTDAGEELQIIARSISDAFDTIDRNIMGKDIQPKGAVKLTAPSSFSYYHLPRIISSFNREYPEIEIDLRVTNTELNMSKRDADIAIRVCPSPPDYLVGRKIASFNWGIYAAKTDINRSLPTSLNNLSNYNLIGASGILTATPAFKYLEQKFARSIVARSDDLIAMVYMVEKGQRLALLPDELEHSKLHRLFTYEPGGINQIWILTHPDLRKVERIRIAMKYISAHFTKE